MQSLSPMRDSVSLSAPEVDLKRLASPTTRRELENVGETDKANFVRMKKYAPYPAFEEVYTLEIPHDSLIFDSRFESGNLAKAIRVHPTQYNLYLSYDTETKGHTQWYYFSVKNEFPGTYTFNIVNLLKYDSLYNEGLLPAVRSTKKGKGWHRDGFAVTYYENVKSRGEVRTYTLTFSYTFADSNDTVFFAHCFPYTFSDLCKYLDEIRRTKADRARVCPMCKSLAGNVCEVITITHNIDTYRSHEEEAQEWAMSAAARRLSKQKAERQEKLAENLGRKQVSEHKRKQGLVFTARVHPGETPGSFMMKGVLDFLLSDCREAKLLRKHYIIKVVPMLNPDGVRYGNYRCSVLGVDQNRRWDCPSKMLHPTIFHTKKMIQAFAGWHNIVLFCDFHGHSCKRGIFAYGCSQRTRDLEDRKRSILARMVPLLLSQRSALFSYPDCHFRIQKSKESTARIVAFKELGIVNSYTIEASFYGPKSGTSFTPSRNDCHMTQGDYEDIGKDLCGVCLAFVSKAVFTKKLRAVSEWLRTKNGEKNCDRREVAKLRLVTRSKSMQESITHKVGAEHNGLSPPSSVRNPSREMGPFFRSNTTPIPDNGLNTPLSELESIPEGDEEDEVLPVALQEDKIWEDLLEQEDILESSNDDDAESDDAPSDHGEPLRLPTPKSNSKRRKGKRSVASKACRTEASEEKPESEGKITRRNSHQSLRFNPQRVTRPPKSPKNCNGSIVTFTFVEDPARASAEFVAREAALRKPGRLAELLRNPDLKEESPLQINGRAKLSERGPKVTINHYSYMALQRHIECEKQESPYAAGNSSRVISANHFRRRFPGEAKSSKVMHEDIHRRAPRLRQSKGREGGTTIEEVLQLKEERKHSELDVCGETSLLGVLPKFRDAPQGLEQILREFRGRRAFKLIGRVADRI